MTISTLTFTKPIPPSIYSSDHPALRFYAIYGQAFSSAFSSTPPEDFYAADCIMYAVDGSTLSGGQTMWDFFGTLYQPFAKVTRDMLSLIVVSDDEAGTHAIHIELVTTLWLDEMGERKVDVPQAFKYVLGRADEGKGTVGLQFRVLRCYYDMGLMEKAKASL